MEYCTETGEGQRKDILYNGASDNPERHSLNRARATKVRQSPIVADIRHSKTSRDEPPPEAATPKKKWFVSKTNKFSRASAHLFLATLGYSPCDSSFLLLKKTFCH